MAITNAALWLWLGASIVRGRRRRAKQVAQVPTGIPIASLYPTLESWTTEALGWSVRDDAAFEKFVAGLDRRI